MVAEEQARWRKEELLRQAAEFLLPTTKSLSGWQPLLAGYALGGRASTAPALRCDTWTPYALDHRVAVGRGRRLGTAAGGLACVAVCSAAGDILAAVCWRPLHYMARSSLPPATRCAVRSAQTFYGRLLNADVSALFAALHAA